MPYSYDIETDVRYNQGIEKGIEKGKEEFIVNLLFDGTFSMEQIASIGAVSLEFVLKIKKRMEQGTEPAVASLPKKGIPPSPRKRSNRKPAAKSSIPKQKPSKK